MTNKSTVFTVLCLFGFFWGSGLADSNETHHGRRNVKFPVVPQQSSSDFWTWIKSDEVGSESNNLSEGRTFGRIRKMQMFLIPLVFKFGVLSTLIGVLVALALKSVLLLKAILFLNLGLVIAKLFSYKSAPGPSNYFYPQAVAAPHWTPWLDHHGPSKEVHVHIHNHGQKIETSDGWHSESQLYHNMHPYVGYARRSDNFVNNQIVHKNSPAIRNRRNSLLRPNNIS